VATAEVDPVSDEAASIWGLDTIPVHRPIK
jgi:hypothetical protein